MADPHKDDKRTRDAEKRGQDEGRQDNAAQPPRTMDQDVDPGSYPPARVDDAVELVETPERRRG